MYKNLGNSIKQNIINLYRIFGIYKLVQFPQTSIFNRSNPILTRKLVVEADSIVPFRCKRYYAKLQSTEVSYSISQGIGNMKID